MTKDKNEKTIELEAGAGGQKSSALINVIRKNFTLKSAWKNLEDDGAVLNLGKESLVFTTDAFIVDPIFFSGGDIGKIAMCGTINDLLVMGAKPVGISLSLVIEEGFPEKDFEKIMKSIGKISKETKIPIVTGDTKVTEKGKIDKIEITTSGIGLTKKVIGNSGAEVGDVVISSGNLGNHTVALLSERFNYKTKVKSDCQPLVKELQETGKYFNAVKDPTRGGLAAVINEIADKSKVKIILAEDFAPYSKEACALSELLGIDKFAFPSEGRFVATTNKKNAKKVIAILQKYNKEAKIIGEVQKGRGVYLQTNLGGMKPIDNPRGKLIPRIC